MRAVAVLVCVCAVCRAVETTPNEAKPGPPPSPVSAAAVNALVEQLTADEYADREAAAARLVELGPAVKPLVQEHLAASSDPETSLRLRQVLEHVGLPRDFASAATYLDDFIAQAPDEDLKEREAKIELALTVLDVMKRHARTQAETNRAFMVQGNLALLMLTHDGFGNADYARARPLIEGALAGLVEEGDDEKLEAFVRKLNLVLYAMRDR